MSFLEGIDLSDAAERSIRADLELRRKDPRTADRFFRYAYQGGADLCLQHGRFWKGAVRPEQWAEYVGQPGGCYGNSIRACMKDDRLVYVEGYCTTSAGLPFSHGWCIDRTTDQVVDLTLPCGEDQLDKYLHSKTKLPILHPSKWGYFGVAFTTELVVSHDMRIGLPMLDRSGAEMHEVYTERANPELYSETHDNPILKVKYEPMRDTIEGIPFTVYDEPDEPDDWEEDEEEDDTE